MNDLIQWAQACLNDIHELPCWFFTPEEWCEILPTLPPVRLHNERYITPDWVDDRWHKAVA
jgi:hypothetical protein